MATNILLIHGMSIVGVDWYADAIAKTPLLNSSVAQVTRVSFDYGSNADEVRHHIETKNYSAVTVCDLSSEQEKFRDLLGPAVQAYVRNGGRMAFPTSEGLNLIDTLRTLFDVPWTSSSYYRTTWFTRASSAALLEEHFPHSLLMCAAPSLSFSAKACSYRNVPESDRCFGVGSESRHESLSMMLAGETDASPTPGVTGAPEGRSEDSDVCVAVRKFGNGAIAYFGDVNCEEETASLIAAFCLAGNSNAEPIVPECVLSEKERGNDAFRKRNYEEAAGRYRMASDMLEEEDKGSNVEHAKILGNLAECELRLKRWDMAREAATHALELDPKNTKALYRRARARVFAARDDMELLHKEHGISKENLEYLRKIL